MTEIGSEFMMDSCRKGKNEYCNLVDYHKRYVLSGRTGLYLIAQELTMEKISSVALPAYCCGSMIAPFVTSKFEISFYSNLELPQTEAILIMDYFGFLSEKTIEFAIKCRNAGLKIIVDATQTAFSKSCVYQYADYIVASYRKWIDSLCAAVYSKNGFMTPEYTREKVDYVETWRLAAKKKRFYLETGIGDKTEFLDLYTQANQMLANDYIEYRACDSEIKKFEYCDSHYLREMRRKNARILIDLLSQKAELMFDYLSVEDCPLHVPIILKTSLREKVRKDLIQKHIYCPCHWPIDEQYPYQRTFYHENEMSLICDQRYSGSDMLREATAIIEAMK